MYDDREAALTKNAYQTFLQKANFKLTYPLMNGRRIFLSFNLDSKVTFINWRINFPLLKVILEMKVKRMSDIGGGLWGVF